MNEEKKRERKKETFEENAFHRVMMFVNVFLWVT